MNPRTALRHTSTRTWLVATLTVGLGLSGCSAGASSNGSPSNGSTSAASASVSTSAATGTQNVYEHAGKDQLADAVRGDKQLVYVPETIGNKVLVIDPTTYKVINSVAVPAVAQHVVPSWDLRTLWVNSSTGNALTPINPLTGAVGKPVAVDDPYNLYFTPDGKHAIVMAERLQRIDFRNPKTMALEWSLPVPCRGVNHADYTADLKTMLVSCEFSGKVLVVPTTGKSVTKAIDFNAIPTPGAPSHDHLKMMGVPAGSIDPGANSMPQDVRLTPDGSSFVVADMARGGIWVINATTFAYDRFVPAGAGAHGIYPSRDATKLYVSNRDNGTISLLDAVTLQQSALWKIPGGGSPDMGGVSADGTQLWLSGRSNSTVHVFDTTTGQVTHRIATGAGPHGLAVWPQPGRFSLGHTGNMR